MKKGFYITLSDDDSSPDSDCVKNLEKFLRSRSEEEAKKSNFIWTHRYWELFLVKKGQKFLKAMHWQFIALNEDKLCLMEIIITLKKDLKEAWNSLDSLSKLVRLLTSRTNALDDILNKQNIKKDKQGIDFCEESSLPKPGPTVFVCGSKVKTVESDSFTKEIFKVESDK